MSEHTRADVEAWLAENPWDADVPEEVFTQTFGFQWFVMDRRTKDLGGAIRRQFEATNEWMAEKRRAVLERYFRS